MEKIEYNNCSIWRDSKRVNRRNRISGHQWSENIPLKTFYISGPGIRLKSGFRSVDGAKNAIDFALLCPIVPS